MGEDTVYWEILLSCEQELGKDSDQDKRYVDMVVVGQDQAGGLDLYWTQECLAAVASVEN